MINFKNLIEALNNAVSIANDSLISSHSEFIDTYFEEAEGGGLNAKNLTINYPVKMPDNTFKNVPVDTPIITLIPVYTSKIDEVKLTADLDVTLDKEDLLVSFSNKADCGSLFGKKERSSNVKLEIILRPGENTEGLKNIIEGYEKILRAQIPG
ncbi:DUF2589 domain-containing protein [Chryseobacterium sp. FH1]|uniref:DUF2589 domain-containing protein n=1 Tax=Chryseobacterium sp. FH1 TaxID=1233951 RepID=UPI0004E3476E|nr:DUF2589 domain-containing protein [Chryseobacterium sp. FH1]KFC19666.1 hypothetical protein IO90_10355 [Chryseobacterium sp. FH1]